MPEALREGEQPCADLVRSLPQRGPVPFLTNFGQYRRYQCLYHVRPSPNSANPLSLPLAPPQVYCRNCALARAPISIPVHSPRYVHLSLLHNSPTSALPADSSRQVLYRAAMAGSLIPTRIHPSPPIPTPISLARSKAVIISPALLAKPCAARSALYIAYPIPVRTLRRCLVSSI